MNSMLTVIDQQPDFVVIYKPAGIGFHQEENTPGLFQQVQQELDIPDLFPVHRLDKVTSGLVLFAKNSQTAAALGKQFENKHIEKYYLALSAAKPSKKQGLIKGDMEKARRGAWKLTRNQSNPAVTQFKSFGTETGIRLFLVKPATGKTHQIRVALKSIGAPILGDALYGCKAATTTDRTYLHAFALRFRLDNEEHAYCVAPQTGEHFLSADIQVLIKDRLTPPWKIDFPQLKP